jgi:hypothetical protein
VIFGVRAAVLWGAVCRAVRWTGRAGAARAGAGSVVSAVRGGGAGAAAVGAGAGTGASAAGGTNLPGAPDGVWVITLPPAGADGHLFITSWLELACAVAALKSRGAICALAHTDVITTPNAAQRTCFMTASGGRLLISA